MLQLLVADEVSKKNEESIDAQRTSPVAIQICGAELAVWPAERPRFQSETGAYFITFGHG